MSDLRILSHGGERWVLFSEFDRVCSQAEALAGEVRTLRSKVDRLEQPDLPMFGTTPVKLVRRDDPDTSHAAAASVDTTEMEKAVLEAIASFGPAGCISDEIRALPQFVGYAYSSVTARYKALVSKGFITDTGRRRAGESGRPMRVLCVKPKLCPTP